MLSTSSKRREKENVTRAATRLKNISQRRARFHCSDDRSFVYITISAMLGRERKRREKEDIHLLVAFDVDVWGDIHYRRHCYVRELPLFLSGRNAMGNKSDNVSCAPTGPSLSLFHYFPLLASPITGYRIRDNELQYESAIYRRSISAFFLLRGKFLSLTL